MTRSVLLDTETTGLDPMAGDRVIEIAAVELIGDLPTGRHFHSFIHPGRDIPEEVVRIHSITLDQVREAPRFEEVADKLLQFLGDGPLIAHNAAFDFSFLNAEFSRVARPTLDFGRMICTLELSRQRFPGMPNSLDALCRRFGIDLSERATHNALLDCRLLAEVYVELTGGRQRGLMLTAEGQATMPVIAYAAVGPREPRLIIPSAAELAAHAAFVARIKGALWNAETSSITG
jgi:DNA polymerase-3 subunit epsilon